MSSDSAQEKTKPTSGTAAIIIKSKRGTSSAIEISENPYLHDHFSSVVLGQSGLSFDIRQMQNPEPYRYGLTLNQVQNLGPSLRDLLTPDPGDRQTIIQEIYRCARDFWLVKKWARWSADFGSAGLTVTSEDTKQKDFCRELVYSLDWQQIDYRLHYHLTLSDTVCVWWRYYKGGKKRSSFTPDGPKIPEWVEILPLDFIDVIGGKPAIYAYKFTEIRTILNKPVAQRTQAEKDYLVEFPKPFLVAVMKNGKDSLFPMESLKEAGYDYYLIHHWSKADWEKFTVPQLYAVLADFKYILMCMDIDFSAAYQMKAGLVVWSIGPENPDPKNPGPKVPALKALEERVRNALSSKYEHIFAGNDLKVRWLVPPADIFMREKYESALWRIMDILGIPTSFWTVGFRGEGAQGKTFSSAQTNTKAFRQQIETTRRILSNFSSRFFRELCLVNNQGPTIPLPIMVYYDPNVLIEDRVIISKAQLAATQGLASQETVDSMIGLDFEIEVAQKKAELTMSKENSLLFLPHYSPTRGSTPQTAGGGPGNPGAGRPQQGDTPTPGNDQPRPSTASEEIDAYNTTEGVIFEAEDWLILWDGIEEVVEREDEVGLNIEVTPNYIRIPMNPGTYDSYRMGPMTSKGLRFLFGIKDGVAKIATVLFNKKKWTMKRAKEWVAKHKGG